MHRAEWPGYCITYVSTRSGLKSRSLCHAGVSFSVSCNQTVLPDKYIIVGMVVSYRHFLSRWIDWSCLPMTHTTGWRPCSRSCTGPASLACRRCCSRDSPWSPPRSRHVSSSLASLSTQRLPSLIKHSLQVCSRGLHVNFCGQYVFTVLFELQKVTKGNGVRSSRFQRKFISLNIPLKH